jgi:hypothetical protein
MHAQGAGEDLLGGAGGGEQSLGERGLWATVQPTTQPLNTSKITYR